eukprot:6467871-Pyramimonas_sp.AAC.2
MASGPIDGAQAPSEVPDLRARREPRARTTEIIDAGVGVVAIERALPAHKCIQRAQFVLTHGIPELRHGMVLLGGVEGAYVARILDYGVGHRDARAVIDAPSEDDGGPSW